MNTNIIFYNIIISKSWIIFVLTFVMSENNLPSCPDAEHVCASMMNVVGVSTYNDGKYCSCPGCYDDFWDELDDASFTWYHHERADWLIQYKFCEPIMPQHTCKKGEEMAAIMRTNADGWHPHVRKLYCRCSKNKYHLQGWHLVDGKYWDYHYICEQPKCKAKAPCVKHYLDKSLSTTTGYRFQCSCDDDHLCPIKKIDFTQAVESSGEDKNGKFIEGFCQMKTTQKKKKPT